MLILICLRLNLFKNLFKCKNCRIISFLIKQMNIFISKNQSLSFDFIPNTTTTQMIYFTSNREIILRIFYLLDIFRPHFYGKCLRTVKNKKTRRKKYVGAIKHEWRDLKVEYARKLAQRSVTVVEDWLDSLLTYWRNH